MRAVLQNGKDKIETDKKNREKVRTEMKTLIDDRKAAMEEAISEFEKAAEAARAELRKEFPADSENQD